MANFLSDKNRLQRPINTIQLILLSCILRPPVVFWGHTHFFLGGGHFYYLKPIWESRWKLIPPSSPFTIQLIFSAPYEQICSTFFVRPTDKQDQDFQWKKKIQKLKLDNLTSLFKTDQIFKPELFLVKICFSFERGHIVWTKDN